MSRPADTCGVAGPPAPAAASSGDSGPGASARRRRGPRALGALLAVCLLLVLAAAGCGKAADESADWKTVATTDVSGKEPVKLNLGTYKLGGSVRLSFSPAPTEDRPVTLTFVIMNVKYGGDVGRTVTPQGDPDVFHQDQAITLAPIPPGEYRVLFTQRFDASQGPGYDLKLTLSTKK